MTAAANDAGREAANCIFRLTAALPLTCGHVIPFQVTVQVFKGR